jgi:hypothetical protein
MTLTLDANALDALARYRQACSAFQAVGHGSDEGADLYLASESAAEELGKQVAALAQAADSSSTNQLHIVQDSPEVIESARILIGAMAGELRKIIARGSDTARLDLVRETAGVSGHLNAMQLHGLLSMEKYGELMAEKVAAARNVGA